MIGDTAQKPPHRIAKQLVKSLVGGASLAVVAVCIGCGATLEGGRSTIAMSEQTSIEVARAEASSDRNLAESLLYQWWGLFEAPAETDVLPYFEYIFADDTYLKMEEVELDGRDAIQAAFASLPPTKARSHHLNDVTVTPLGDDVFQLDASFVYQIVRTDGEVTAGNSSYTHKIQKLSDGAFRLIEMTSDLGDSIPDPEFKPSYFDNRARGTIVQYLGVIDLLESDYARLTEVLAEDAVFHGMVAPGDRSYSARGDGVLMGRDEITLWLSDRKNSFRWVGHKLMSINVEPIGENRFEATTRVDVEAQPIEGEQVSVTLPIKITLEDKGGRFMQIVRIDR